MLVDPNVSVGNEASSWGNLMVEICIAMSEATGRDRLVQGLAGFVGASSVSFDAMRNEVRVRSQPETRALVHVIAAVETWLADETQGWAKLSVGDRSYTMVGPGRLATPSGVWA